MPFCTKCGNNIDDNAKFCSNCGNMVVKPQANAQQPGQPNPQENTSQQPVQPNPQGNAPQQPVQQNPQANASQQPVQPNPQANAPQQPVQPNPQQNNQQGYAQNPNPAANFYQTPDGTYVFTGPINEEGAYVSDVEKNKYLNILSYLGIFLLIPMFCAKGSKYTRFHVNQGLILFICSIVYNIAKEIIMAILRAIMFAGLEPVWFSYSPVYAIYSIVNIVLSVASLVFLAFAIYGIYNTVQGRMKELPIIGKIRIIK